MSERLRPLISPNNSDPSKRGGGFDDQFTADLQAGFAAVREQSHVGLRNTLRDLTASGRVGYDPQDLVPAGSTPHDQLINRARIDVNSAFNMMELPPVGKESQQRSGPSGADVSMSEPRGVLDNTALEVIAEQSLTPRVVGNRQPSKRRILAEGSDGQPLTDAEWNARNADVKEKNGSTQLTQLNEGHKPTVAEQDVLDDKFLERFPKEYVETAIQKYGRQLTLDALRGDTEFPNKIVERGESRFIHASTGETMSVDEVDERMGQVEAARIGKGLSQAAELATTKRPFHKEIIDTERGLVHREVGRLDDSLTMMIETNPDGTLGRVEVIATDWKEDGISEAHTIDVVEPNSEQPVVLIDGEPATQEEAPIVEAVIAEIREANYTDGTDTVEDVA